MKRIICADDEPSIQRILKRILESRGYEVHTCANGQEVLQSFRDQPADLVLLDVSMPIMSGIEACKELRKRPDSYDVPIIMVSGIGNEDTITEGLSSGADDYILKPFQPEEILAKVSVALKRREAQTATDLGMAIGSRFVGRYDITRKLGSGGFSSIFHAMDVSQDPALEVALKIFDLPVSKRSDSRFISLFLREAYELAKLDHPNIVKLHEFGQTGHFYFLALEFLKGEAVDQRVTRKGPMESADVIHIGYDIARALEYLHEQKIVHRDVKPANLFILEDGSAKLVDFGLAKQQDESTLSLSDEFRGTPAFVSPEYILGNKVVDIRSDIYSLGATLYYAMSSVILFAGKNAMEILNKHFQVIPPPLQQFDPMVNERFSSLIDQMLAKEREARPTITEVVDEFERIIDEQNRQPSGKQLIFKLKRKGADGNGQGAESESGETARQSLSKSGMFRLKMRDREHTEVTQVAPEDPVPPGTGEFRLKQKRQEESTEPVLDPADEPPVGSTSFRLKIKGRVEAPEEAGR